MHGPSENPGLPGEQISDKGLRRPQGMPVGAGIGLRAQHHASVRTEKPDIAWLEVHSENYFGDGGPARDHLLAIRDDYPISLHGVGLSLGSSDELDSRHLRELKSLVEIVEPALVSEHLCWASVGGEFFNDLLPMPYSIEALQHMVRRVSHVQEYLGRSILVENVSSYFQWAGGEFSEWDFLAELSQRSGCGILLDINNIYVSAMNHGFDPVTYIRSMPSSKVREMHLAGHSLCSTGGEILRIDTHDQPVSEPVWRLYAAAVRHHGPVPTLIEWDADIPPLQVLLDEARKADQIMVISYARVA
jgi:uncharacterized protein (UPF0276 family)